MFYNRFSMLLHLALMAFPTTFYLRLMSTTTRPAAKTSKFDGIGEIWLELLFFVSFGKCNSIVHYTSRINSENRCSLEALFQHQWLKLKFFNGAAPKEPVRVRVAKKIFKKRRFQQLKSQLMHTLISAPFSRLQPSVDS